ncbi:hypothetical protein PPYR_13363 [Photinus pyralis]|uniref:Uncharacterized protein n=1 Tax=Photinus pyralis TaxID=7054 RepID=A0A1Y1KRD0_PHOPY|nr:uncharacterized protein LOC116177835 [Photinus pyralis]KAB0793743.1 hypothetical protein PPYR_13363 [Photinus pyralis]
MRTVLAVVLAILCTTGTAAAVDKRNHLTIGDVNGDTPLHLTVRLNDLNLTRLLLIAGADINAKNNAGIAPLHMAIYKSNVEMVKLLLEHGANVDAQTNRGNSPLHEAVAKKDVGIVTTLLKSGASLDIQNEAGNTPLLVTLQNGLQDIAQILITHSSSKVPLNFKVNAY